jgi:hypothetical protein
MVAKARVVFGRAIGALAFVVGATFLAAPVAAASTAGAKDEPCVSDEDYDLCPHAARPIAKAIVRRWKAGEIADDYTTGPYRPVKIVRCYVADQVVTIACKFRSRGSGTPVYVVLIPDEYGEFNVGNLECIVVGKEDADQCDGLEKL